MEFLAAFIEQAYLTPGFTDAEGLTQVANPQLYKAVLKTEQYQIGHCAMKSLKHQTYEAFLLIHINSNVNLFH